MTPGAQVEVELPSEISDVDKKVWGWVLEVDKDEIKIVIDNGLPVLHRNPKFANNSIVKLSIGKVRRIIPQQSASILITTASEDDTILEIRRIDGKTKPMKVLVDRGDESVVYLVDHIGKIREQL